MSVVFFDGFNTATADPTYWTLTANGVSSPWDFPSTMTYGTYLRLNSSAVNSHGQPVVTAKASFPSQTSGKVYIGFQLKGLWASFHSPYTRKLCSFHTAADDEICTIYVSRGRGTAGDEQSVIIKQGATTLATYYLGNPLTSVSSWRIDVNVHWEFELDIENDTVALRVNGQYLINAIPASPVTLPTTFDSVAAFTLYGNEWTTPTAYLHFDDFFVVNDSGTFANTWMGTDTYVRFRDVNGTSLYTNDGFTNIYPNGLTTIDGDATYAGASTVDAVYAMSYQALSLPSGTAIAALKLADVSRGVSLPVAYRHAVVDASGPTVYEVGDTKVSGGLDVSYPTEGRRSLVTFLSENPITNAQWTAAELDNTNIRQGFKTVAVPP